MITTNTPLAMFLRKGTETDPYIFITETNRKISDGGTLVLREFPINQAGYVLDGETLSTDPVAVSVVLNISGNNVDFTEVKDPSVSLSISQFRVDYQFGLLHFNPDLYGAAVIKTITYAGRGAYYIAASRIYDDETYGNDLSQGELFTTLQDVLNSVTSIAVNSTTTGAPGTDASVSVTGTQFDFTIPRGDPFTIAVEYDSISDMNSNTNPKPNASYIPSEFDLALIISTVEDPDNGRLYIYDGTTWDFVTDMSGATGPARDLQWKSESTGLDADAFVLRWANFDNSEWDVSSEKNLALTPSWAGSTLTITREGDNYSDSQDLGITPSWNGTELTLSPNDGSADQVYDLGITPSWDGSELTITPNSSPENAISYDIGVVVSKQDSEIIFTPNDTNYSPVSYDIGFVPSWDANGTLTITPNDTNITPISYDLGWEASFTGTTLSITPDNGDAAISADLGLTPSWSDTTLSLTPNTGGSAVSEDLGITPSWNNSVLTLTPNYTGATGTSKDLGLDFSFTNDELTISTKMLDEFNDPIYTESVSLGLQYSWTGSALTIQDKVGGVAQTQELGTLAEWGDGNTQTVTSVRFQNGDGTYSTYQELSLDAQWNGTELTIITPNETLDPVNLKADTPNIVASVQSIAYNAASQVAVTEGPENTFYLSFSLPVGRPLDIDVTYPSIADMQANTNPTPSGYTPNVFDLAMIQSPEGAANEDNAKLYICNAVVEGVPTWVFVSDLSGATGQTGEIGPMPDHQWVGTSLQFELPEGGYGDLVELKGDNADDFDINNTSIIGKLNGIDNQKTINEYFEINKVDVSSLGSNILLYPTLVDSTITGYKILVDDSSDANYPVATDVYTTDTLQAGGTSLITGSNIEVGRFITTKNIFIGNPGVIGITTVGNIKKIDANTADAAFYFTISKYDTITDTETLVTTSGTTPVVSSLNYEQFFETALLNNETFAAEDYIVITFFASRVGNGSDPIYAFQFGGASPVRTLFPVPISVLPLDNKLNISGGTMTGDLIIDQADFRVEGSAGTAFRVDADLEKAYIGSNEAATLQSFVAGVTDTNSNTALKFWTGTQAEYNAIVTKDSATLYFVIG